MKTRFLVLWLPLAVWVGCAKVNTGCVSNADCPEEGEICLPDGTCGAPPTEIPPGYCSACQSNTDCAEAVGEGSLCVSVGAGTFCGVDCSDLPCPDPTMVCVSVSDDQGQPLGKQCLPVSGDCSCTPLTPDTVRECANSNEFGTCLGEAVCNPEVGFVGCDAPDPAREICDGIDNNCDGVVDGTDFDLDGISDEDPVDVGGPCGTDVGVCEPGVLVCEDGKPVCSGGIGPSPESCDTLDNDCDGFPDDDPVEVGEPCGIDVGECEFGSKICVDGEIECQGGQGPVDEICDGLDNDCDGQTDEIEDVGTVSCGLGVCANTSSSCETCVPLNNASAEQCNGLDDDCDGQTDEGLGTTTCGLGICQVTVLNCIDGVEQTCTPGTPQAVDLPDPTFEDSNCDGIDGEIDNAIFVSPIGVDVPGCGSINNPCASIQTGINEAVSQSKRDVYVAGGTYNNGTFFLADGVNVFGGFGSNFQRDPALAIGNRVATVHGLSNVEVIPGEFQAATVVAVGLSQQTILADLTLIGVNTTNTLPSGQGKSSHVIIAKDIPANTLFIERNVIIAGNGAPGSNGSNGQNASPISAVSSMNGAAGTRGDDADFSAPKLGGAGGTNPSCGNTSGGRGGDGGDIDGCGGFLNLNACPGKAGSNGAQAEGAFGKGGSGGAGSGGNAGDGGNGGNGKVTDGSAGTGGSAGGRLIGFFWYGKDGSDGGIGQHGGGGGGGGGGGASDNNDDDYGSSGGGGGAGGCRAPSAGGGGKGAGGSFGIYLINASPRITGNSISRGNGGKGGNGGAGGQGQSGGTGGAGPSGFENGGAGGRGGDGGRGGHSGGGGGGSGGISFGVYATSSASVPVLTGNLISGGSAGAAGSGGTSPGASGAGGASGTLDDIGTCQNASGC